MATILAAPVLGEIPSSVGAAVIDHQDIGVRERVLDSHEDLNDVLRFVIGGENDERLHIPNCRRTLPSPCARWRLATHTMEPMSSPLSPATDPSLAQSALPSVGARVLAFVAILIGGTAGGFIGFAFIDLQVSGDTSLWAGLGAFVGAVVAALGTAVVVILTLRAMGEWNTIRARNEAAAAAAKAKGTNRNVPRVR